MQVSTSFQSNELYENGDDIAAIGDSLGEVSTSFQSSELYGDGDAIAAIGDSLEERRRPISLAADDNLDTSSNMSDDEGDVQIVGLDDKERQGK